ncbi:MAG: SDR family oxidoreductase [Planctomycetota bacterium]
MIPQPNAPVLVTGASGYIGARLVTRLLAAGYRVRCFVRDPAKLASRPWHGDPNVEIMGGDASEKAAVENALQGCSVAYYLIHSMVAAGQEYRDRDAAMARLFGRVAASAGIRRVIYLGGLGELGDELSEHLRSRREVETELASGGVPVTVFRAAMIIGSGSTSFEILRYLVERLPVMVTPRWVRTESQPIAVRNVLNYLVDCLEVPETAGQTLDIGGPDVLRYDEIMREMAAALRVPRRRVLPVPVLTPKVSSWWIHLITPVGHRIARPLAEGLRNRVVCRNDRAITLMPQELLTVREAIAAALRVVDEGRVESAWLDAGAIPGDPDWAGGRVFEDRRETEVAAAPEVLHQSVTRIGGRHGWYAADFLWRLRGLLDRLVGGPGLRRGRRDPNTLSYGDALDFWRVTSVVPGQHLALRAEMKVPGTAQLDFHIEALGEGRCRLVQHARFRPRGLLGLVYWYAVLPVHGLVFQRMLNGLRDHAQRQHTPPPVTNGNGAD